MNPDLTPTRRDAPANKSRGSTTRVIVVDDQAVARRGTCDLLQNAAGIDVQDSATNRAQALRLAEIHRSDVLVTEAKLPDGLGTELSAQLRKKKIHTKVLILSAYREAVYLKSFLDTGAAGYLLKQDDYNRLVDAVRGIKRGNLGWFSRSVASRLLSLQNRGLHMDAHHTLTSRETEVLEALAQGLTNREIAVEVELSIGTVKNYLTQIYEKLGVEGRSKAIVWAYEHGVNV